MALADILRQRVSRRGRTAQVDCGELGTVTVEALPPRECAALGMADSGRALLYAACRELQAAGETLRRERRLFTPDEVTQYVSDKEARTAARTVLALSGVTLDEDTDSPDGESETAAAADSSDKNLNNVYPDNPAHANSDEAAGLTIPTSALSTAVQNRREIVQLDSSSEVAEQAAAREKRLETVHETVQQMSEIRLGNVQFPEDAPADGQVSREFFGNDEADGVIPSIGADLNFTPLNLALSEINDGFVSPLELSGETEDFLGEQSAAHETKSEVWKTVHEDTSEIEPAAEMGLHEMTSEFGVRPSETLHESKSEVQEKMHEIRSEFPEDRRQSLHETESEFLNTPHETKSEIGENRRVALHETTSELAEQVAQRLLEGLRRAAAVR